MKPNGAALAPGLHTEPDRAAHFTARGGWRHGVRYGLIGLPLAFLALPLYVQWPNHYAREFGVPLAALGAVLLGARLFDALVDPLIGRWCDGWFARSHRLVLGIAGLASVALALGFVGLFFPPMAWLGGGSGALLVWALVLLALTYTAYSVVTVAHQSWGARYGGTEVQRSRVVAWREGLGLVGVLVAAVLPGTLGLGPMVGFFTLALALGGWAWWVALPPVGATATGPASALPAVNTPTGWTAVWHPWRQPAFRRLLAVFMLNGIASAVPATLVLFFIQDRLQSPAAMEPVFLGTYFLAAALSIPLWLRVVGRLGLAPTWLLGMGLSMAVFFWASLLDAGAVWPFVVICALSGLALGTDLALPSALLAGVIGEAGDRGQREGAYFGWWGFATKLNLALAAGLALPVLAWFGYSPGQREPEALQALVVAYCLLPCALKALAALALHRLVIRPQPQPSTPLAPAPERHRA